MNVHFLEPSPYLHRYLDFIRGNSNDFPPERHRFVLYVRSGTDSASVPEPSDDLRVVSTKLACLSEVSRLEDLDTVIVHGLFNPYLALGLLLRPKLASQTVWCIWGGDLYFFKFLKGPSDLLFEAVRKRLIPRIPFVVTFLEGDLRVARQEYGFRGRHLDAFYLNPLDHEKLPLWTPAAAGAPKRFLVGNSGAPTNEHIDALQKIANYASQSIEVICPLSYGGPSAYVEAVVDFGHSLFGKRFIPLLEFLTADAYTEVLRSIDIAVMNQNRQQALGNIFALVAMGKPIYLRSDTSTFAYFSGHGIDVWDIHELGRTAFHALPESSRTRADHGRDFIARTFSESRALRQWRDVFLAAEGSMRLARRD